jgi:hypothetical protein
LEKQSVRSLENPAIITQVDSVTIITLVSFTAEPLYGKVTLDWATESEINNIGFNLYRAESENGK